MESGGGVDGAEQVLGRGLEGVLTALDAAEQDLHVLAVTLRDQIADRHVAEQRIGVVEKGCVDLRPIRRVRYCCASGMASVSSLRMWLHR